MKVLVPDHQDTIGNVVYGQNSPTDYLKYKGYFGAVVGRVANRIKNGCFSLGGKQYQLPINNVKKHTLHGGNRGLSYRLWNIIEPHIAVNEEEITVMMEYVSPAGEEGFPGDLTVRVTYIIRPMEIGWKFFAFTNKKTIVNLTNHSYWNLEGIHTPIYNHILTLKADRYSPIDQDCLPLPVIRSVGEKLDFRDRKSVV